MNVKKFLKDITGITAREEELRLAKLTKDSQLEKKKKQKQEAAEKREAARNAKLSPKDLATKKGEPWVDVIDFKISNENIRNGFFELDWNEQFIVQLKNEGYGLDGDPDEEIVERWYRDICAHVAAEEDIPMNNRTVGNLNLSIRKLPDNKSEIG